jgi:hypothetical protein
MVTIEILLITNKYKNCQNCTGPVYIYMLLCNFNLLLTVLGKKTRVYCRRIKIINNNNSDSNIVSNDR